MGTLTEVNQQLQQSNTELDDIEINTDVSLTYLQTLTDQMSELIGAMSGNRLDELEARREATEKDDGAKEEVEEKQNDLIKLLEDLGLVFAPFAAIIGTTIGAFQGYVQSVKAVSATVSNLVKFLTRGRVDLAAVFNSVINSFKSFGSTISKLFQPRAVGGAFGQAVARITKFFKTVTTTITNTANSIRSGLSPIISVFSGAITEIRTLFQNVLGRFSKVTSGISKFGQTVGAVAKTVGRLFAPLNFIFIAFETITGALEGFKEGGILGALQGGIKGFIDGFIAIPLDLLKSALSWLARNLGMEGVATALESFSFSDIFGAIVDIPFNLINKAVDFLKKQFGFDGEGMPSVLDIVSGLYTLPYDLVKSVVGWIAGKLGFEQAEEFLNSFSFSDIIESIVKAPFELFEKLRDFLVEKVKEMSGFLVKILPGPLKKLLGIDGEKPEEEEEEETSQEESSSSGGGFLSRFNPFSNDEEEEVSSSSTPERVASGDELQMESEAQRDAEREALGRVGGPGSNAVSVSTNVQNNSNTTTQTRPSASSQPDNMSDTMLVLAGP
jgi:hypothetical protein